jgi:hypothetical protein
MPIKCQYVDDDGRPLGPRMSDDMQEAFLKFKKRVHESTVRAVLEAMNNPDEWLDGEEA